MKMKRNRSTQRQAQNSLQTQCSKLLPTNFCSDGRNQLPAQSQMWGQAPENSLISPYRILPSLTVVLGGSKSGRRAGKGSQQQVRIAHLCSLLLLLRAALPASCQYHHRHPPHAHHTFTTQVSAIAKAAARFTSQSVSTSSIFKTKFLFSS
jgi:hypothetical protein